jgi:hypothetical protein
MADHTDHKLNHHTFRRSELGSVDADFLHRAGEAPSFLRAFLRSPGEERFTPVLHGGLHRSLHRSTAGKARQVNQIEVPKTIALREGWHDVRAGATPPFDALCVTELRGAAPALPGTSRRRFARLHPRAQESCQTRCLTFCMK